LTPKTELKIKNEKEMGYYERYRKYYAKATKMYFEEGFSYRPISKLIPVAATTIKHWCIIFAEANGIKMRNKIHKIHKSNLRTPKLTGFPYDIYNRNTTIKFLFSNINSCKIL